jgi:hypothetical protein
MTSVPALLLEVATYPMAMGAFKQGEEVPDRVFDRHGLHLD